MTDQLPSDPAALPTLSELLSQWLGFQLPSIRMPQTLRNLDKAVAKVVMASGENIEARIRTATAKAKTKGKIDVEGMARTEEEKRKLENKLAATKTAIEEIAQGAETADATAEIEDDWLNFFSRLAEDKSSAELQTLFGRILAGEIKRPGSFSLRTMQLVATISKAEAEEVAKFLSYALDGRIVVKRSTGDEGPPTFAARLLMEELGIAGNPSSLGGITVNYTIPPYSTIALSATNVGIGIVNNSDRELKFAIAGQGLTKAAGELIPVGYIETTGMEYLREVAKHIYTDAKAKFGDGWSDELVRVQVGRIVYKDGQRILTDLEDIIA